MQRVQLKSSLITKPQLKHGMKAERDFGLSSMLTNRIIRMFCNHVEKGHPMGAICDFMGIETSAFWHWVKKGEKYLRGNCQPTGYRKYGQFVKRLRKANSEYLFSQIDKLTKAKKGDWIKHMAILERKDKKNFSRKEVQGGGEESFDQDERFV